jgi:hypothetical protein
MSYIHAPADRSVGTERATAPRRRSEVATATHGNFDANTHADVSIAVDPIVEAAHEVRT